MDELIEEFLIGLRYFIIIPIIYLFYYILQIEKILILLLFILCVLVIIFFAVLFGKFHKSICKNGD